LNTKRKQDLEANTNTSNHSLLKMIRLLALVSGKWNIVTIVLLVCKTRVFLEATSFDYMGFIRIKC
jgi:hypothetical protein